MTVASDADFKSVIDEVTKTPSISKNTAGSVDFNPTSPLTEWTTSSYYKITINVSNSKSSNYGFCLSSIVFYKTVADKTATTTAISDASLTNTDLKNGTAAGSLTASVTAGGSAVGGATVTWESSDPTVATIASDGTVTLAAVGTTTITATYAGDATYYGSSDTYDLTVTDTRVATVTTIDDSGLTNTDVYTSTTAGQLTASVTAGGSPVAGATVTWESSDPTVATIDTEGNVTLVKAGSTTITATYGGAGSYAASSDTYALTVTDSNAPLLYESVSKYTNTSDNSTKITSSNASSYLDATDKWDYSKFSDAYPGKNGCFKLGSSSKTGTIATNAISLTGSAILTFQAMKYGSGTETGPLNITVTGATATGDVSVTGTDSFEEYTVYLNNATGAVVITFATASKRMYLDEIKLVRTEKENVAVSSAGLATYVSDYNLDYTGVSSIEAYVATESAGAIVLTKKNKVPAGAGVLLRSVSGEAVDADIPVATGDMDDVTGNLFVRGTGAGVPSTDGSYHNYILNKKGGVVGFYRANDKTVAANRAYLHTLIDASAGALEINFDEGDATGIADVRSQKEQVGGEFYNLAGQRVSQPTKGLYIVNGKKVIIK